MIQKKFHTLFYLLIFISVFLIFPGFSLSQNGSKSPEVLPPPRGLENKERVPEKDLLEKKEGLYFNGLPLVNSDPDTGIGYGVRIYSYYNGERKSPYFAYTPYRYRIYAQFFQTTEGWSYHGLNLDAPYFLDTLLRIRTALVYERDTNKNYFGSDSSTLNKLSVNDTEYDKLKDYLDERKKIDATGRTSDRFNKYDIKRPRWLMTGEYDFLGGIVRLQAGFMIRNVGIHDYSGENSKGIDAAGNKIDAPNNDTLLLTLSNANRIKGFNGGWDNYYKFGIALDTRDFEPDPKNGIFIDATVETTGDYNFSDYSYTRSTIAPKFYYSPIPGYQNLTLALRGVYTAVSGDNIPFFTINNMGFTEEDKEALGGYRSMRGFVDNRFVGKVITLVNFEIRERMFTLSGGGQIFNFILVPFIDFGRVFDRPRDTSLRDWKMSYGAGLRIAWNQATIIMIDYGMSSESTGLEGLYINFNHIF